MKASELKKALEIMIEESHDDLEVFVKLNGIVEGVYLDSLSVLWDDPEDRIVIETNTL